jgi:hypothetical protein
MIRGDGPDPVNQLLVSTFLILVILMGVLLGAWLLLR